MLNSYVNSYENEIKYIYIDPPYNTGSDDFAYPDNFKYDKETLLKMGLSEEEAERVENLYGKSTHSAWLTFMLPRLTIARDLLSKDGVIFISIDDNEFSNLKCLCDEIFGEDNFVATFIVVSAPAGTQSSINVSVQHSYCLCYAKKIQNVNFIIQRTKEELRNRYYAQDNNGKYYIERLWKRGVGGRKEDVPTLYFPIYFNPKNKQILIDKEYRNESDFIKIIPYHTNGVLGRWTWSRESMIEKRSQLEVKMVAGEYKLHKKVYENEEKGKLPFSIIGSDIGRTEIGGLEVKKLFDGKKVFQYPKNVDFIKYLLSFYSNSSFTILDFFSGSATTAHAVMQLNAEDGGNRKFILVNIQEPLKETSEAYKAGFRTICDIGIERIKRASKKIKEETKADIDYGFKIYELNNLSEKALSDCLSFNEKLFTDNYIDNFKFNNIDGKETILQTWKVDDGYGFNEKYEEVNLCNMLAYKVKKTLYLINPTTEDFIKPLVEKLDNVLQEINKIVVFGYSYTFSQIQSLNINVKTINDIKNQQDRVKVEVRY